MTEWMQTYDPAGSFYVSVAAAAVPLGLLLGLMAGLRVRSHIAAGVTLAVTCTQALLLWGMPAPKVAGAAVLGGAFALFPVAYIVVGSLFIYNLTVETGRFAEIRRSLEAISRDRRVQALLVGYCFNAFLDSTTGFLTPVTISSSILAGLGFPPIEAARLGLLGASMPSAFGAMGLSIVVLSQVSGIPQRSISVMSARQMPLLSFAMPFVLLAGMHGTTPRLLAGVLPHAVTSGGAYALALFLLSSHGSHYSAALVASLCGMLALLVTTRLLPPGGRARAETAPLPPVSVSVSVLDAWAPFILLTAVVLGWSLPRVQRSLDAVTLSIPVPGLHNMVLRVPPAAPVATPMAAAITLNWLSAAGTGIAAAAVLSVALLRVPVRSAAAVLRRTALQIRFSVFTMVAMFAAAYVMNYSGMSTTLALGLARSGGAFPFLSPILGWLGAVMVGSNTASDAMFASLQVITADSVGMPPVLAVAANGVAAAFGKMLSAQHIAVTASVVGMAGAEAAVFRRIAVTSVLLAASVGLITAIQAYLTPSVIP